MTVGGVIEVRHERGVADTRTRDPYIWLVARITQVDPAPRQHIRYSSANRTRVSTGVRLFDLDVKWICKGTTRQPD